MWGKGVFTGWMLALPGAQPSVLFFEPLRKNGSTGWEPVLHGQDARAPE